MKRVSLLLFILVFSLSCVGLASAASKTYELKIQTAVANSSMYFKTLERAKKNIEAMTQGQIKVELLAAGAVVGAMEIGDAVSQGVVNGGQWWTHYASGKNPSGILFSALPGGGGIGLDEKSVLAWYWEGDGQKFLDEYYQQMAKLNIKAYLNMPMGPEPFGWFNKKYTAVAELNKVKFRSPPGVPAEIFKEMGMPVVSMPGPDIIPAAQRGVIDAAEWIGPAEDMLMGFAAVWKHYYLQGLHQALSIGDVLINKTWYDGLPANLKAILDVAMKAVQTDQAMMNISLHSAALQKLVKEQGVTIQTTPADYYPAYMKAAKKVLDKYYEKDPFFKKVFDSQMAWAQLTVPYVTSANGLYYNFGKTAMDTGVIKK
jgi:TRAP-type mannitol/chloroaromatic compound transport system substrate-binding protein